MSAAVELSTRVRVSDPRPSFCSMCGNSHPLNERYFDCQAAFDAGAFGTEQLVYVKGSDDLHIGESCARELCEFAGFKPELHGRQLREIRRLELQRDHWRDAEGRMKSENDRLRAYIRELEADRASRQQAASRGRR